MKFRGRFQKLGTQLILFYMIISLIVLSFASYFIYTFVLKIIKENNETLLLQQFQQLDHNIVGLIDDVDSLSKFFLLDPAVQRFLNYTPDKGEFEFMEMKNDLHERIAPYINNYDFIDSIYIVGDVQGLIGGTNNTTLVHSSDPWLKEFMQTDIFVRSHQVFPEMIIQGGIDKSYYNPYKLKPNDGMVVSMARGVRPLYQSVTNAVLILNVDETYLSSIYSTALQAEDGKMYIVNEKGIVISSSNPDDVGTISPYNPFINDAEDYGSYDHGSTNSPVQVMYYRLNEANWYMMKEIPLNPLSVDIYSAQTLLVFVILVSLLVMFVISYFWLKKMTRPLHILAHKMKDMSRGEIGITFAKIPNNEFGMVIRRFNEMSLSIVDLIQKTNEMQEKRRELEIEALQNQINPHFLYNTLNMIRWMASSIKADNIVNSVVALGNILRPAFTSKEPMCTLRDELSYLENYIKIINWRFSNSVVFSIDVDEVYLDHRVPRFILQPLIENSITFGRQEDGQPIHIQVKVHEEGDDLMITVTDSGVGIPPARLEQLNQKMRSGEDHSEVIVSGNGIGLYNVNKRIQLNDGPAYGVRLVPRPSGTEIQIRLPKHS
ncbi:sensor histidine kinase [Paenibacillus lautus]|uniref:sensor histidine kinase n=1 Tax=Paenibacillus lautus TaxID=1401 RepID=UPI002DBA548D|nr:histidine kinase [Paenibacillus lautus]MEC0259599.1 histidine kinase [Paenibacillus lautus]